VDNVLYFVDIDGKAVHSYDPSNGRHTKVDTPAKAAAVRANPSTLSFSFRVPAGHGSRPARRSLLRHTLPALNITRGAPTGATTQQGCCSCSGDAMLRAKSRLCAQALLSHMQTAVGGMCSHVW